MDIRIEQNSAQALASIIKSDVHDYCLLHEERYKAFVKAQRHNENKKVKEKQNEKA